MNWIQYLFACVRDQQLRKRCDLSFVVIDFQGAPYLKTFLIEETKICDWCCKLSSFIWSLETHDTKYLKWFLCPRVFSILLLLLFHNMMSSVLLDEDAYGNLTKDRSSPPEKDVGGCVGLLYQFSRATSLISHGLVFTVEHQRLTITRPREPEKRVWNHFTFLSGPRSPQTKACVSMTTLRWDPLLAIDSSQSALSAEGGSGDKERLNSICSE